MAGQDLVAGPPTGCAPRAGRVASTLYRDPGAKWVIPAKTPGGSGDSPAQLMAGPPGARGPHPSDRAPDPGPELPASPPGRGGGQMVNARCSASWVAWVRCTRQLDVGPEVGPHQPCDRRWRGRGAKRRPAAPGRRSGGPLSWSPRRPPSPPPGRYAPAGPVISRRPGPTREPRPAAHDETETGRHLVEGRRHVGRGGRSGSQRAKRMSCSCKKQSK